MKKEGSMNYMNECKTIIRSQGFKGMYCGFWGQALRDMSRWGVSFSMFERFNSQINPCINNWMGGSEETKRRRLGLLWLNAGGVAGTMGWFSCIP